MASFVVTSILTTIMTRCLSCPGRAKARPIAPACWDASHLFAKSLLCNSVSNTQPDGFKAGGEMFEIGTAVSFRIVEDRKTGRPRAEDSQLQVWGAEGKSLRSL